MTDIHETARHRIQQDRGGPTAQLLTALMREIEGLRADAGRLDWIDSQWTQGVHVEACGQGDGTTWHAVKRACTVYGDGTHAGENIRAAIDAAMKGK